MILTGKASDEEVMDYMSDIRNSFQTELYRYKKLFSFCCAGFRGGDEERFSKGK